VANRDQFTIEEAKNRFRPFHPHLLTPFTLAILLYVMFKAVNGQPHSGESSM
jgi:hypothetical protein